MVTAPRTSASVLVAVVGGLVVAAAGVVVVRLRRRRASLRRRVAEDVQAVADQAGVRTSQVVVLHGGPRVRFSPNGSPFTLKLEAYLRAAGLPYVAVCDGTAGPKGKVPWIEWNGDVLPDSQLCIERLERDTDCSIDAWLAPEQRALARAVRVLIEEHLSFAGASLTEGLRTGVTTCVRSSRLSRCSSDAGRVCR